MIVVELYKRFQKSIANLSIYFLASLIPMIFSLVSNPFIAKNMSPTDYAITGYYAAFGTLFIPLVNFYFLHYYTKRYFELNDKDREVLRATIYKALIYFSSFMTVLSFVMFWIYTSIVGIDSQLDGFIYKFLTFISAPLSGIVSLKLVDYRMSRDSKKFFNLSVSKGVLTILITLLFVAVFKWGAVGKMSATLLGSVLYFIYIYYKDRRMMSIPFDRDAFITSLKFCWPLVLASMLTFFSQGYDKVCLERIGEIENLGYYSVGMSIATYLSVFSTSINDTFQPDIYKSVVERNVKKCLAFIGIKMGLIALCVVAFIILAPFIVDILTFGRYVNSTKFAIILSFSSLTSMLYYSMSQVTVALGLTSITLANKIIGSVLSVICFSILIKNFGAVGAAWGSVLSFVFFFVGNVFLVAIKYKKKFK